MSDTGVIYGIFKEEKKNRFLCTVNINGTDTECYIPSSCKLSNFISLSGKTVMLRPINKKNARTQFSVYAVKFRRNYVPLNLSISNQVIENSLHRRIFSFLGNRKSVYREKVIDGYKSDLYLGVEDTIIEIKSILSFNSEAKFPTVFSERANRQLEDIKDLLSHGHKVCYIFVSMYSGVKQISIDKSQETYGKLFSECVSMGMIVKAYSLGMQDDTIFLRSKITVDI